MRDAEDVVDVAFVDGDAADALVDHEARERVEAGLYVYGDDIGARDHYLADGGELEVHDAADHVALRVGKSCARVLHLSDEEQFFFGFSSRDAAAPGVHKRAERSIQHEDRDAEDEANRHDERPGDALPEVRIAGDQRPREALQEHEASGHQHDGDGQRRPGVGRLAQHEVSRDAGHGHGRQVPRQRERRQRDLPLLVEATQRLDARLGRFAEGAFADARDYAGFGGPDEH